MEDRTLDDVANKCSEDICFSRNSLPCWSNASPVPEIGIAASSEREDIHPSKQTANRSRFFRSGMRRRGAVICSPILLPNVQARATGTDPLHLAPLFCHDLTDSFTMEARRNKKFGPNRSVRNVSPWVSWKSCGIGQSCRVEFVVKAFSYW